MKGVDGIEGIDSLENLMEPRMLGIPSDQRWGSTASASARAITCLLALLHASRISLGEPVRPMAEVPPHDSPWIETDKPGIDTVFLWKFRSEEEKSALEEAALEEDLFDEGDKVPAATPDGADVAALPRAAQASAPKLQGGAKLAAKSGRFGGGLALDGSGQARAESLQLRSLLIGHKGITLDLWIRPSGEPTSREPECLVSIPDVARRDALSLTREAGGRVVVRWRGEKKLTHPQACPTGRWTHLALLLSSSGINRGISAELQMVWTGLQLGVNGHMLEADRPDWLNGESEDPVRARTRCFAKIVGSQILLGRWRGESGFRGMLDEVRLRRGPHHFYPWDLGWQELPEERREIEPEPPYFRTGRVLTRFRFDGSVEPEAFTGLSREGKADESHFQRGLKGQALDLTRIDQTDFQMKGYSILPPKEGTIEFWFRPLNWDNFYIGNYAGTDLKWYWLMTLTAKGARAPSKNLEVFRGRALKDHKLHWQKFHPGTWSHMLISVKNGGPTRYVNGQPQKLWQGGLVYRGHPFSREPLQKWLERTGGKDDGTWTLKFVPSPTLIDELSIYSWSMTAEEAWNAYARWLPDASEEMKPLPAFRVDFDYFAHSWSLEERLVARLTCLPIGHTKPVSADIEIRAEDAGEPRFRVERQALDETGVLTVTVKHRFPFGRYPVIVRSRDAAGAVLKEEKLAYLREKPPWLGNTLGKERTVPEPWTPMETDGAQIRVIGRKIHLGPDGLPKQIETLGRQVLAEPITIRVAGPAGTGGLEGRGTRFTETASDRVSWKAELAGSGLSAELSAWMEFDGLLYCAVTLRPIAGAEVPLKELDLDFPMRPEAATQLIANGGGNNFRVSWIAKMIPPGEGSVWNSLDKPYPAFRRAHGLSNYMPHIWLGNDEVGLYVGGENDQGWTVNADTPAQEVLRRDHAVVFRMNVIRTATVIGKDGHRFHFVILPTPAKPEPPDWRQQLAVGGVNFGSCDTFGGFDMKTDPADPNPGDCFLLEPRSWEHAEEMAPQCRAKWGRCILYTDASWPGYGSSFRDWNHDLHAGTGRHAWIQEFEDYVVWCVNEFLRRGLIDGVYWDDVSVGYTLSLASTAYPYAGSKNGRRVGFTALAQRRTFMRLWRVFLAHGKEPCIWPHMTFCYEVPLFSFCRYLTNGEIFSGVKEFRPRDAMDCWSPQTLRILGGAAKWGTGIHFCSTLPKTLPDTGAARQWAYPQRRTEDAAFMAADIMAASNSLIMKLKAEGFFSGPVRAFPWWKAGEVLDITFPEGANVLASVYVQENRAIVFVANRDREPREVAIQLKEGSLFRSKKEISWCDLDPGLKPPKSAAASKEEIARATNPLERRNTLDLGEEITEDTLLDELEGTTRQDRDLARLTLRTEGNAAQVLIRARDYRILEARLRR